MRNNPYEKSPNTAERITYLTAAMSVMAFIFCYLFIGYFNRFSADDHSNIFSVNRYGLINAVVGNYFRWEGSFFSGFLVQLVFLVLQNLKSLFVLYVLTLCLLFPTFFFFIRSVVKCIFNIYEFNLWYEVKIFLLAGLLLSSAYCLSQDVTQIWYWVTSSVSYLYPIAFLVLALGLTIQDKKTSFMVTSGILFFLCAGARFNYLLMAGGGYFLFIAYKKLVIKQEVNKIHYVNFILLSLGGILYIAAPGNYARRTHEITINSAMHHGYLEELGIVMIKILDELVIKRSLYLFILFSPVFIIGHSFRNNKNLDFINRIKPGKLALAGFGTLLLLLVINISALYIAVKTADYPRRVYAPLALYYFAYVMLLFFILGLKAQQVRTPVYVVVSLLMLVTVGAYAKIVWKQYPVIKAYSKAIDGRLTQIDQARQNNYNQPILYLKPLPHRGILPINEVDTDTAMYINSDMRKRFGWKFAIAITDSTARPQVARSGVNEFMGYLRL